MDERPAANRDCDVLALAKSRWDIALPKELFADTTPAFNDMKIRVDARVGGQVALPTTSRRCFNQ
jgi:hypothetical protein